MEILFGALLFACVAAFVLRPLLREDTGPEGEDPELAELEARKEAKYREIRDAELDLAAGKLTEADYERQDAELRRDAVEILNRIEKATSRSSGPGAAADAAPERDSP